MASEKTLQAWICKYLRTQGILVFKFASPSQRGVPDLICIDDLGTFYIEVKHPNGKGRLSKLQQLTIDAMRAKGAPVHVCHTQEHVKTIVTRRFHTGSTTGH